MSKNQIFTSPLGIGLGIGIGTAVGAIVIGVISFSIFKYSKGKGGDEGEGIGERDSDVSRTSSWFDVPQRDSSFSEATSNNNNLVQDYGKNDAFNRQMNGPTANRIIKGGPTGGKHSKKIKRKDKGKGKNKKKFRTLKKV